MAEKSEYILIEDYDLGEITIARREYALSVFSRGALVERFLPVSKIAVPEGRMAKARDIAMRHIRKLTDRDEAKARGGESNPIEARA